MFVVSNFLFTFAQIIFLVESNKIIIEL